ncbi:amidohydrolase family protein [Brassicibacter mesophilus]|uniref:amidohydrolase family protein n=1 Tax=Brassicibacter mesophilus TaxID=745119 RepID=UPI003D204A25
MKLVTHKEGIRRTTSLPAQFIGINGKGVIREKMYADIVIFDYKNTIDKATYETSEYSEGIEYVIVNNKIIY